MEKIRSKFFEFIKKALSEDNGNPSFIRTATFYPIILWSTGVFIGMLVTIFWYRELWVAVLGMILGGIFSMLGVKAYQKGKETSTPLSLTPPGTTTSVTETTIDKTVTKSGPTEPEAIS